MIGTVTDPYNKYEETYKITRKIMEQLVCAETHISVVTKSKLVLRDIDLFKKMKDVEIVISLSILDESIRKNLELKSSTVAERLETLKILRENGIRTVVLLPQ